MRLIQYNDQKVSQTPCTTQSLIHLNNFKTQVSFNFSSCPGPIMQLLKCLLSGELVSISRGSLLILVHQWKHLFGYGTQNIAKTSTFEKLLVLPLRFSLHSVCALLFLLFQPKFYVGVITSLKVSKLTIPNRVICYCYSRDVYVTFLPCTQIWCAWRRGGVTPRPSASTESGIPAQWNAVNVLSTLIGSGV